MTQYVVLHRFDINAAYLLALFLTLFDTGLAIGAPFLQDIGTEGVVSVEAEGYHASVVAPDGHEWLSAGASFPGFAGTDALQALPEDGVGYGPGYSTLSPQLDYQVDFVATGPHYVWVRALGPSGSSNSLHVGLDGAELATSENMNVPVVPGYEWRSTIAGGARSTVNVDTVGVHTVNVWMRESGTVVDKVVLTTDPAYDPSVLNGGLGPDESPQGGSSSQVETPAITPDGGTFAISVLVTLSTGTADADIYYTLDGSDPTTASLLYTAPFLVTDNAVLKARAFKTGLTGSVIATAIFEIQPLPSGLSRYFSFDEVSGSSYTDIVAGVTATCTSCPVPAAGRVNGAQQYDGIADEVNLPDDGVFDWAAGDRFTIEAWVNKGSACAGGEAIVGRHDTGSQLHWWLGCENDLATFVLIDTGGDGVALTGTTTISDGQWHHLAAVRDAITGENRLYVDGVEEASALASYFAGFGATAELNIGWLNDSALDYHFAGTIDEVALHNRVLSPVEVSRHYLDGMVGLQRGYWGCDAPIKIMPLGDSITDRRGYRPQLYFDLINAGYDVDFVGSRLDTSGVHDRDHEGHAGFTPADIEMALTAWLTENPPDVILLHIGTNEDFISPYPSSLPVEELHNLVDTFDPAVSMVQARIINKVPYEPLVTQFNDNVEAMVASRVVAGDKAIMVDHESALNYVDDMDPDGIHPNQAGFDKMAPVWFDGLSSFLPACNQTLPQTASQSVTTAEVGIPYVYTLETRGYPAPSFSLLIAPVGMTIHPDTGQINWVPGVAGIFNVSVQVQNLAGTTTHDFTIDVDSSPGIADGDINGDGQVNVADVLLAQRITLGGYIPTAAELQRGDVAPLIGGVPSPDGQVNVADVLLIQRKSLGLVNF